VRRRPDAPPWLNDELTRLSPTLAYALAMGRSLLNLNRGELQREPVTLDDVVEEQRAQGVTVQVGPGVGAVSGDLILLRLALASLLDAARSAGVQDALSIRAVADGGRLRLSVTAVRRAADAALAFARRIAELHGGGLSVETETTGGTRYTLTLPTG
jgi:signal transduction histidine kinase